ncbi:MAG: diguanylate cyclase [Rhodanobacteraceae bacterium]|nr:diguanylate cyclase [Rhodanobacteraceae bacterium]MBP9154647.1 diguanylate cyclase [Xanthomonadales bacterium]HQW80252.1 GGDEF domain-containing protein [Pseudomonadota bacterium]
MHLQRRWNVRAEFWPRWLLFFFLCASSAAYAALADSKRHPLELEALSEPERVLAQLPALIAEAVGHGQSEEQARLELARANACRVMADWPCQRDAAAAAVDAAGKSGADHLAVRGLIAEARARIAMQDFSNGEHRLGSAEAMLAKHPDGGLLADVMLAYSSMALQLGRHQLMRDYAQRGIDALGEQTAAVVRARLLRNLGRAELELGHPDVARAAMLKATTVAAALDDPKLISELDLELARIARNTRDISEQRAAGERVLAVAKRFDNAQIAALGHEVLGLAARDSGELALAETELRAAVAGFEKLVMQTEQRRALRELLRTLLQRQPDRRDAAALMVRLMELDEAMDRRDRAMAGDDFDARLRYAQQEFELHRLARESELAGERERLLSASNRWRALLIAIAIGGVFVTATFLVLQRRANLQLSSANAKLRLAEQRLEREARIDALTGLANRREFESRLSQALAGTVQQGSAVALLFLDIDHLKQVNDGHGHGAGDTLIRCFATRLAACISSNDLVARIGGDEFVVLLEMPEQAAAIRAAETMATAVCAAMTEPLAVSGHSLPLGASIGIAVSRSDSDGDRLMTDADQALYAAKAAGRGTWRRADVH